jgi:hypothetical protein
MAGVEMMTLMRYKTHSRRKPICAASNSHHDRIRHSLEVTDLWRSRLGAYHQRNKNRRPMVRGLFARGNWIRNFSSAMPRHRNSVGAFISAVSGGSLSRQNSSIGLPRPTLG